VVNTYSVLLPNKTVLEEMNMSIKKGMEAVDEYFRPFSKAAWDKIGNPMRKKKVESEDTVDEEIYVDELVEYDDVPLDDEATADSEYC
jgi:hypothetical protein